MFDTSKIKTLFHVPEIPEFNRRNAKEGLCPVRMEGLEPPCLAALDPKSSASTNFATSADFLMFLKDFKNRSANLENIFRLSKNVRMIET